METFKPACRLVDNPRYVQERRDALKALDPDAIDEPIVDIISGFNTLHHCFTLQCCYGHFVCTPEQDPHSLQPIPHGCCGLVRYRIAYIAFCIENNRCGKALLESLAKVPVIDPGYIQFGSADWFERQWLNSYALQVEPLAHQLKDEAVLESSEAFHTQKVRDLFFRKLRTLLATELNMYAAV